MAKNETLPERAAAARAIMLEIFMDEDDECIPEAAFNDPIMVMLMVMKKRAVPKIQDRTCITHHCCPDFC